MRADTSRIHYIYKKKETMPSYSRLFLMRALFHTVSTILAPVTTRIPSVTQLFFLHDCSTLVEDNVGFYVGRLVESSLKSGVPNSRI